jgi:hypothetical protein
MKRSTAILAITLFLGAAAPAFAESLSCTAGDFLSIQGELQDGIFTARTTVTLAGTNIVEAQNLKYKKSAENFLLVEDDAARSVEFEGRHFVPEMLDLTIGTPSLVYFMIPYKDAQRQLHPVLVRATMTCEEAPSGPMADPQYSLH